ncbi:ECU04_0725 [Encephalitozoon cuniculi GB-M1]|uniref:ECU04_0725 protein n=1 Tax=Encephalitozoon cuniculi (strain GB-M1) TaxID=284813 RepID=I7L8H8_ENCCU|nr:uncharacterized protein ECU04_0725 [Encephalitozoon cuniculi GB-M1]KMV66275.1 hypothetical protein M970_040650 [Encephalitozoon cuniculi EcunIII-L]UYI27451.1 hypothetical protein J0A71_06g13210 [Encephalitozoon cuniculi]CCI73927.1 ECU04_0725 [Encephalitozoon cuniculi GB-M1]
MISRGILIKLQETSPVLIVVGFFVYQMLETGVIDMVEHACVNSRVYRVHNFPDILGMKYDKNDRWINFYAFKSGVLCTFILLIPLIVKLLFLALRPKKKTRNFLWLHLALMLLLAVADTIVLFTCDRDKIESTSDDRDPYIYRNHRWFYLSHAAVEVISLVCTVFL